MQITNHSAFYQMAAQKFILGIQEIYKDSIQNDKSY